jgi:hypothetical protein
MGRLGFISSILVAGAVYIASADSITAVDMTGTVSDTKSGNPVVGATVTLANNPTLTTMTDAQGNFHLTGQATVGVRSKSGKLNSGMSIKGAELSITVQANNTPVAVDIFNLKSEHVRTVLNQRVSAGRYNVNVAASELPSGVYFVRARVGGKTASFKVSTIGVIASSANPITASLFTRSALAKVADDPIDDTLKISKVGYKPTRKAITLYNTIYPVLLGPLLPAGDLKIVSERNFPQVDWGSNVDVQVWDGGSKLIGDYKPAPFEGTQSWMVNFVQTQSYNAWGFVAKIETPEDMSAWKGGTMHLAVKGTAHTVGVTMASADQGSGTSVKVDLSNYGYKPDGVWHEAVVPVDSFVGTNMSQINVYCGLVYPMQSDTVPFNANLFYQVDDIYWSLKK